MYLIGVDYHPSFQAIAFFVEETGEYGEQELNHSDGQAERFYRDLKQRGISVRVGMEATGHSRWFERLLAELGFELWIGDPAEIKAKRVKKQKFDRADARLLLRLLRENNFPQIWVPDAENRDLRQLLWHRHRLVQMRTRIMNQLHALAMNEGYCWKKKLFSEQGRAQLEKLALAPWASRRRQELLELLDRLNPTIEELTAVVEREARKRPEAKRLMTHPGVGSLTALAFSRRMILPLVLLALAGITANHSLAQDSRLSAAPAPSNSPSGETTTSVLVPILNSLGEPPLFDSIHPSPQRRTLRSLLAVILSSTHANVVSVRPGSSSFGHGTIQNTITYHGTGSDVSVTR